jgi:hypothetical protein
MRESSVHLMDEIRLKLESFESNLPKHLVKIGKFLEQVKKW